MVLICVDKEGAPKFVLQSPSGVFGGGTSLVFFFPGAWVFRTATVFAVLFPLLFGWWSCSPRVRPAGRRCRCSLWSSRALLGFLLLALLAGSVAARGGLRCWSSPVSAFFVPGIFVFGVLVYGIFADFDVVTYFGPFFAAFSELRSARQVGEICGM